MRIVVPWMIGLGLLAGQAIAQDSPDSEDAFDEALKNFGYTAGLAWQCGDSSDRPERLDRSLEIYNRLTQLFGTERAFYFAAAFGAGSNDSFDAQDCERHIADFETGMQAGRPAEEDEQ